MKMEKVYSSAITRHGNLDSWDIENLKYIRKISQLSIRARNENYRPTIDIEEDESISVFEEPIEVSKDLLIIPQDFDRKQMPVEPMSLTRFASTRLRDCYLLDVVTVQNDSMIALCDQNDNDSSKQNTQHLLFNKDSTNSFEINGEDFSSESIGSSNGSRDGSCCSSRTTSTTINGAKEGTIKQKGCPFCKDSFYFLGEGGNAEDVSLVPTMGGESPPQCPRSPSPYYVRLRRELPKSISPSPQHPKNFGMNRQGHLVIDYSPNWTGLENYVKNLKR